VVQFSFEVGDVQFGVRTNSEAAADWLEQTFGDYVIDDETAPYYSLLVGGADGDAHAVGKRYHILYEESRALIKTLDLRQVGEALVAEFNHVGARSRDDAVYVGAALVGYRGSTALVPSILPAYIATLGHRVVERSGLSLPTANYVALDPGSGRVVAMEPSVEVSDDALDELGALAPAGPPNSQLEPYDAVDVDALMFLGAHEEHVVDFSAGQAGYFLASQILNVEHVGGAGLEALARLLDRTPAYEIRASSPKDAVKSISQALQGSLVRTS
jgi:hypothetical protein